jgi:elongation factor 3
LGALTRAIQDFGGGVLIISHNKEFTDALCNEHWLVQDGIVHTEGGVAEEEKVKALSASKIKKSQSLDNLKNKTKKDDSGSGNTNSAIQAEVILNPRTLEGLSKKEARKLERCAEVAGVTLKEYVSKITCKSPEWKWL